MKGRAQKVSAFIKAASSLFGVRLVYAITEEKLTVQSLKTHSVTHRLMSFLDFYKMSDDEWMKLIGMMANVVNKT